MDKTKMHTNSNIQDRVYTPWVETVNLEVPWNNRACSMNFQSEEEEEEQRWETKRCPNSGLGSWTCQDLKHLATSIAETEKRVASLRCSHLYNVSNTPSSNTLNSLSVSNFFPIFNLFHRFINHTFWFCRSVYNKDCCIFCFSSFKTIPKEREQLASAYYPKLDQCVNVVGGSESGNN